jgi:hypothetical protein
VLHLFGEPVPLGENAVMFRPLSPVLFQCHQFGDPHGKPLRGLDQPVALEGRVVHHTSCVDHVLDQRVQRARPRFLGLDYDTEPGPPRCG